MWMIIVHYSTSLPATFIAPFCYFVWKMYKLRHLYCNFVIRLINSMSSWDCFVLWMYYFLINFPRNAFEAVNEAMIM